MKTQLVIALNLISITAFTQPVIPASHALENGTLTYSHADNQLLGSLDPGPEGANQIWDFSQYSGTGTTSHTNTDCPGDPNCADFSMANKLGIAGTAGTMTYYHYSVFANNEFSTIGGKNVLPNGNVEKTFFDDPQLNGIYPITYQQMFSDTWATHSDPAGYNSSGSKTVTVDAYGTLTTPSGTFPNTLRIKTVLSFVQNSPGNPALTTNSTIYTWVSPAIKGVLLLMTFNDIMVQGSSTQHTRSFTFGNNGVVSIEDLDDTEKQIEIYPNPGNGEFWIKSSKPIRNVKVYNFLGVLVENISNREHSNTLRFDISYLSKGLYFIQIDSGNWARIILK